MILAKTDSFFPFSESVKQSPLASIVKEDRKPEEQTTITTTSKVRSNLRDRKRKSEEPVAQQTESRRASTPKHNKADESSNKKSPASKQVPLERSKDSRDRDKAVYDKNLQKTNLSPKVLVKPVKTPPNSRVSLRRDNANVDAATPPPPTRSKVAEKRTSLPTTPRSGSRTPSPRPTKSTRKAAVVNPSSTTDSPSNKGESGNSGAVGKSSPAARAKSPSHAASTERQSPRTTRANVEVKRESRSRTQRNSPSRLAAATNSPSARSTTRDSKTQEKVSRKIVKSVDSSRESDKESPLVSRHRNSNRKSVTPTPDERRGSPALKGKQTNTNTQEEDSSVTNTKSTAKQPKCDNNSASSSRRRSNSKPAADNNRTKGNKQEELIRKVKEKVCSGDKFEKDSFLAPSATRTYVETVTEVEVHSIPIKVRETTVVVHAPFSGEVESPKAQQPPIKVNSPKATAQKPESPKELKEDSPEPPVKAESPKPPVQEESPKPPVVAKLSKPVEKEEIKNDKHDEPAAETPTIGADSQVSTEERVAESISKEPSATTTKPTEITCSVASQPIPAVAPSVQQVKEAQASVSSVGTSVPARPKLKPTCASNKNPFSVSSLLPPPPLVQSGKREKEMHFKKMHLLNDSTHKKESKSEQDPSYAVSSGINVNVSITDQLAKVSKEREKLNWNNNEDPSGSYNGDSVAPPHTHGGAQEGARSRTSNNNGDLAHHPSGVGHGGPHPLPHNNHSDHSLHRPQLHSPSMTLPAAVLPGEAGSHRHTDSRPKDLSTASAASSDYESSRLSEDRAASRSSADEKRPSSSSSSLSNSRMDDYQRRKEMDSQGSSPLVFDKNKPVEVYRDPELLKRDERRYLQQQQQQHQQAAAIRATSHTPVPPSSPYPPAGVHNPIPSAHAAALAQRTLLSGLHYGSSSALGALSGISPHLGLSAHQLDHHSAAALRTQAYLQQQYQALGMPPQHLSSYAAMHTNVQATQLEMLWQQKYPTLPMPPTWMLMQYQDELLRDVNMLREREIAVIERDRRDREIVRERERERERADQERREREERYE